MGQGSSGVGQGTGHHWLHVWEEVGVGLSLLCLGYDLFASRLFWFSTWRDLGTLSKVQTPGVFSASSSSRSRTLGSCKALTGSWAAQQSHWPRLLHAQIWTFHGFFTLDHASQKFPWKRGNLGFCIFVVVVVFYHLAKRPEGNCWDDFKSKQFNFSYCNRIFLQNLQAVNN